MPNYHQVKCVGISVQPEIVQRLSRWSR